MRNSTLVGLRTVSIVAAVLVFGASAAQGAEVLVEAEGFADCGGWVVDQQFMDIMGSPYLLAHGLGRPVAPARTEVEFPETGTYRLWVRTRDWVPGHSPGRFRVRLDGREVPVDFGTQGEGWLWQDGGQVEVGKKRVAIELVDLTGFDGRCDALLFTADQAFVPPRDPDETMAAWRRRLLGLPETPPSAGRFDLVVVGGGIAGCSAAIAAARLGCTVALIQDRPVYGGNNSPEIRVHTGGQPGPIVSEINGGYGHEPGDPKWLEEPSPPTRAAERRQAVLDAEKNLRQFLGWHAFRVQACGGDTEIIDKGGRIESVDAKNIFTGEERRFAAPVFIDCTGDGSIGAWAGASYYTGREGRSLTKESLAPEHADNMTLGTSLCWGSRDAGRPVPFPEVPWATAVSKDSAAVSGGWNWEYGHHLDTIRDAEEIRDYLLRAIYGSFATAKRQDPAKYANYELLWVPYVGGKRESRRLRGDYVLTQNDIQAATPFPDGVATGTWGIDLHYPTAQYDFRTTAPTTRVKPYRIPFRCLYSQYIDNLMMAGRCISVTHVALGSTRVMNTCGQTGVATGAAAYLCKKHAALPRGIYKGHLEELLDIVHGRGPYAGALAPLKPADERSESPGRSRGG